MDCKDECVCQELKRNKESEITLEYGAYTSLVMGHGWISAHGEDYATTEIKYCPFCGKKIE